MFLFFVCLLFFSVEGKMFKISDHNQCTKDRKSISESFFTSLCLYLEEEFPTLLAEDSCLFLPSMFFFRNAGCIGCPDWNRCCTRDVFGSCVECPSWNKCCYKTGDPVCVASNHGCDHIRRVASGNLEDARVRINDLKPKMQCFIQIFV